MKKTTRWILLSVVLLATLVLTVRILSYGGDEGINVTAEAVKRRTLTETVSASGKLYPETEIKISSPIYGEVTQLLVQEGDTVKKGQVLARIQGDKNAAASRPSGINVPPGLEGLVQSMQPGRNSGPSLATVTAPITGTITVLNMKRGERIGPAQMPGSEAMRIADMNNLEVRVDVNENNIIKISIGDSADVEIEAYNRRKFKGVVTAIANSGTRRDAPAFMGNDVATYEVHIRLLASSYADLYDSSRRRSMPFRPGMNARAEIKTTQRENVLAVPVGAVVSKPKGEEGPEERPSKEGETTEDDLTMNDDLAEVVYVLGLDGTVTKREIITGIQDITYFEITSGLQEGEKVITGPYSAVSKNLRSGKKVQVVSKEKLFQNE